MSNDIKIFDEDTIDDVLDEFINSRGFRKIIEKVLYKDLTLEGETLSVDEFCLKDVEYASDDWLIDCHFNYEFKPSSSTFESVITERFDDEFDSNMFNDLYRHIVEQSNALLGASVLSAVSNHNVLRVVNGGYDSILLGDLVDLTINVSSTAILDLSNCM